MTSRLASLACLGTLALASRLPAQTSATVSTGTSAPNATAAVASVPVPTASAWEVTSSLRASVGWRENVTVSAVQSLNRAFARAEAELFALRTFGTHAEVISFLSGDVLRYFSPPPGVPGDQQWIAHLEGRWQPGSDFRASLKGVGFLQETFIDPSQTEGALQRPLWVRLRGGYSVLTPRITLPWGFSLEPSFQVKRIGYRGYAGDYTETRPGVKLEWKRSERLVLSAVWYDHLRHYSELTQSTAGGRALRGRLLSLRQREADATASTTFDGHGTWTIAATAGRLENRDRAFGYLDYNQDRGELDVNWNRGGWRVTATGEARRLNYLVQTVGLGIAPTPRITDGYDASLRIERDLSAKWMVFAEGRWERNRSNVTDFTGFRPFNYRTDTVLCGIQRSF